MQIVCRRWELVNEENKVLDITSSQEERKILALLLEDRRLQRFGIFNQYERIYLPVIRELHDKHYETCKNLALNTSDKLII